MDSTEILKDLILDCFEEFTYLASVHNVEVNVVNFERYLDDNLDTKIAEWEKRTKL